MRIVFLYTISKDAYDYLKENIPEDIEIIARIKEEYSGKQPNQDVEIIAATKEAEILMGPYVTEEILEQASPKNGGKLKLIIIPWTGIDRLNFTLLRKYPVVVANSHGNARTVAEHAIALLLTATKNIIHHDKLLRKGDWGSRFKHMPSVNIFGKTVGLLGYGAIGIECAKILRGFDVEIIGCRRTIEKSTEEQKKLAEKIYSINELEVFLNESDIVINSLPLTQDTRDILSKREFEWMKDGVIIVNVGRGATINEEAIYNAVKEGKVFAAGLDPQWKYPPRDKTGERDHTEKNYPSNFPIHEFDQVVLSPHRAADLTEGYERKHWFDVVENILRIYKGEKPTNIVDLNLSY